MNPTPTLPPSVSEAAALPVPSCVCAPSDATQWFKKEVHAHGGQLKSWLRGQFPSVRDVDDVLQESYLRVWKVRATQPVQSAKALLFTIARRIVLDDVRRTS